MPVQGEFFQNPGGASGFYDHQIEQSVRFDSESSSYLSRTQGTPTNVDICTISCWVKRAKIGAYLTAFTGSGKSGGGGQYGHIGFGGDGSTADEFYYLQNPGTPTVRLESNALFRDTTGWTNIVIAQDSTQGTAANRNKIYFNGTQYTDWGDFTAYSTQNSDFLMNSSGHTIFVGSGGDSAANAYIHFDGYIAEYIFIDGTQNAVTDFGETKNGVWIPKDPSGLTFGNNGFYLKFGNSGSLGTDSSGNGNNLTAYNMGADHQVLDSPTFGS